MVVFLSRSSWGHVLVLNMRLKALAEIDTMHSFAQLCNLNFCQLSLVNLLKILQKKKHRTLQVHVDARMLHFSEVYAVDSTSL